MAGVDKIIGEILEEAEKAANENRQEAQKKADAIWKMRKRNVQRLKKRRTRR